MHWSVNDQSILAACSNGMLKTCVTFTKTLSVGMLELLDLTPCNCSRACCHCLTDLLLASLFVIGDGFGGMRI
jgi:hypothetical protein